MASQPHGHEIASIKVESSGSDPTLLSPLKTALPPPEQCVICLDQISEEAIALPCHHAQFDFACLGTWLQRQQVCPLCKGDVKAIRFAVGDRDDGRTQVFYLPPPEQTQASRNGRGISATNNRQRRPRQGLLHARGGRRELREHTLEASKNTALDFRRDVYRQRLYSLHVGTNRISRYRNLTPSSFAKDERLTTRARMWIRRELQVFDFLNPDSSSHSSSASNDRRASNADFLLEYIISILKSIDLKGSTGQAEELLKDFLGRENARLFLHELEAWLRSPYEHLKDWDRSVQYAIPSDAGDCPSESRGAQRIDDSCGQTSRSSTQDRAPTVPSWFSERFVLGEMEVGPRNEHSSHRG